jgi:peptidoglycan/xylan/chitin deacetylase (PgdA/CDA1 family)
VLAVTPDLLERQLEPLVRKGYRGATFDDAVHRPPARRTLAVTFDDAYRSVLTHAVPVLDRLGLVGTIYVPTDFAGSERPMSWPGIDEWIGGPHEHELVPLNWGELRDLADRGWEIGSHTRTHPRLLDLDDRALDEELAASRAACEQAIGRPCRTIAYPFGHQDARVRGAAERAGYTAGAGLDGAWDTREPMAYPRVGLYPGDEGARFALKVAPAVRGLRSLRRSSDNIGR